MTFQALDLKKITFSSFMMKTMFPENHCILKVVYGLSTLDIQTLFVQEQQE